MNKNELTSNGESNGNEEARNTNNQEFALKGFHEPTSPMRVSATRRLFFGGSGDLSGSSLLSTGRVAAASLGLAGLESDSRRTSISGTRFFAGVSGRFGCNRGERDGGREMVDSAGVVSGVSTEDEDVSGTAWLCAIDWNCSVCCWTWCAASISSKATMMQ